MCLVGVVDHLPALVPVDVGGGARAILHPTLEAHGRALVYVEIFRPDNHCPGLWNQKKLYFNENSAIHICEIPIRKHFCQVETLIPVTKFTFRNCNWEEKNKNKMKL